MDAMGKGALLAPLIVLMLAAPAMAAEREVRIVDDAFDPQGLEVDEGDTIVWTNQGSNDHTVTADDGSFDSGSLSAGDSFRVDGLVDGTVRYHCSIHGGAGGEGMSGVLFVRDVFTANEESGSRARDAGLASTGSASLPPGAFALFALTVIALGVYLTRYERIVYPERYR